MEKNMKHFKNGALSEWQQVKAGAVIGFESTKARRVSFQVNANSRIEVWAASNEQMKHAVLQAVADDKVAVEYTAKSSSWVQIRAEKTAAVFVNIRDVDQRIENSGADSFVNIEPRVRKNDDFAKMMRWVQLNEERRDAAMADERAELARLKAELSKQESENQPQPVPEARPTDGETEDATGETAA
jgi:predicted Fe-S protein YdhL (DUF1289 family)